METVQYKKIKFQVWDIGGQHQIRKLWRHYYENTDCLIYVVDSSDKERVEQAAEELHSILNDENMRDATLLVFANKQDTGIMTVAEVAEVLRLHTIKGRDWNIQGTCGLTGDGLFEGLEWMSKNCSGRKK